MKIKRVMKNLVIIALLAALGSGKYIAQTPAVVWSDKAGWHKLGEKMVNVRVERDEILVLGADKFSAIKFKVVNAPVEIMDLEIFFEAGDKQAVAVDNPVVAGTESGIIELAGGNREIKKIAFRYKTLAGSEEMKAKKARIEFWGLKTHPKEEKVREEEYAP